MGSKNQKWEPSQDELEYIISEITNKRKTAEELGREFGFSRSAIYSVLKRNNIKLFHSSEYKENNLKHFNQKYTYDIDFIEFLNAKGYCVNHICQILDIPYLNLNWFYVKNKIKRNRVTDDLTPFQFKMLVDRYSSGMTIEEAVKGFDIHPKTATYWLKRMGVTLRKQWDKVYKHDNFNNDAFLDMEEEKSLYFYGLLLADGCLSSNGNSISLGLKEEDGYMVEAFAEYLRSDSKIYFRNSVDTRTNKIYKAYYFSFSDKVIADRLKSYGFAPRKSAKEIPPPAPIIYSRHFWRGMVDGDGSLSINKNGDFRLSLVGSFDITSSFNKFVEENIEVKTKRKIVDKDGKGLTYVLYTGPDARAIAKLLYKDSNISLIRKYKRAEPFF